MRLTIVASLVAAFCSFSVVCASPEDHSIVTYYDRNGDGAVDYELHQVPGTKYWTWAYIDSKFAGRYDRKLKLAYPFDSERVDIPVPHHVKLVRGMPPVLPGN
jgi:hypothetical protein